MSLFRRNSPPQPTMQSPAGRSPPSSYPLQATLPLNDVSVEEHNFKEAMREYERTAKPKYRTGINPDATHTVAEVEAIAAAVLKQQKPSKSRGLWEAILRACQKLGDAKEDAESWIGLVPTDTTYLSIVCGGLKLIFSAASRFNEVQDKILEALEQIPVLLDGARRILRIYNGKESINKRVRAFYTAILAALGRVLHYIQRRAVSKAMQAIFQPASFQQEMVENIEAVAKAKTEFQEEASICQMESVEGVASTVQNIKAFQENASTRQMGSIERVSAAVQDFRVFQGEANTCQMESIEGVAAAVQVIRAEQTRQSVPLNLLMQLLQGDNDAIQAIISRNIGRTDRASQTASPPRECRALIDQLQPVLQASKNDIVAIYGLGPLLSHDDQERSVFIVRSSRLATWLAATESAVLMVNENAPKIRRQSACSFVCARLVTALEQIHLQGNRPDIVPLGYFCGEHKSDNGLAKMLTQLLERSPEARTAKAKPLDDQSGLPDVWRRFLAALQQLPTSATVICLIDGLSWYLNDGDMEEDANGLVHELLKLTRTSSSRSSKRPSCAFKLLLTGPNRLPCREIEELDAENFLNVPTRLRRTGEFTEMRWQMAVNQQMSTVRK